MAKGGKSKPRPVTEAVPPSDVGKLPAKLPVPITSGPSSAGWHKIQSFLECPKKYQYEQVRGIHQPTTQTPDHFTIGILFHLCRAHWFACHFRTDEETLAEIRNLAQDYAATQELPMTQKAIREALAYFEEYVRHWSPRPKPNPIAAEYLVGPSNLISGDPNTARTGRLDDVSHYMEAGGKLCIGEAKTCSGSIKDAVEEYLLHGQPTLISLLWKLAPQGEAKHGPIAGVVLDILQKGYGKPSNFSRVFLPTSERTLNWFQKNMSATLRAASLVDWNADVPRNITSCTRMYGRARIACPYRDLCRLGKPAALKYVLGTGPNAKQLTQWKPEEGKETPPWE